jgi:hypothetical protein
MKVTTFTYPPYCPTHKIREGAVLVTRSGKFRCYGTKKPTKRWLKAMIKDERMAHKTYNQYGFPQLAADEARHKKTLQKVLKVI